MLGVLSPEPFARNARTILAHRVAGPLIKVGGGFAILFVTLQLLFGSVLGAGFRDSPIPFGLFVNGLVIGALYALVGMGLILVYRASRVINFAQAALGSVPAILALILMQNRGWPYLAVIPLVLVGGALLGSAVSGVVEAFRQAPRLIVTVVTIGVSLFLAVSEFYVRTWVTGETLPSPDFSTPLSSFTFNVGIVRFKGDHIFTVAVVAAIVVALGAFFRYTDIGIAVRASAENADRASLLGIPIRRVTVVVWAIAAVMSAIGIFLRAPLVGLPIFGFVGPAVLIFGLAAAVIARMESLPTALFAGMGIGMIEQAVVFSTRQGNLAWAVMLPVILGALLLQRRRISRAFETGASSFRMVQEFRPIPKELRGLREVEIARGVLWAVVAGVALAGPFLFGSGRETLATRIAIFALVGVSLVILTGWAGQISLGQFGFAGVGAGVTAGLAAKAGAPFNDFFVTLVLAGLIGAVAAILIGLPALRIPGLMLAVTTLAFAFSVENFLLRRQYFGWLLPGDFEFARRPMLYGRFDMSNDTTFYYLVLGFLVLSLVVARSIRRTRSGRVFMGVRENRRAMEAYGVNVARTRLASFAISGFIAAVAGALLAYDAGSIAEGAFAPERSILVFVMIVVGGINSLPGAMLGAVFVLGVPELPVLRDIELIDLLTSSIGLVFVLFFLPGGFAEGFYRIRDSFLRRVADRHRILVPSLIADMREERFAEDEPDKDVIRKAQEQADQTLELERVGSEEET